MNVINSKPTVTVAVGFPGFVFLPFKVTWPCHWLCLLCCSFGCSLEVMIKLMVTKNLNWIAALLGRTLFLEQCSYIGMNQVLWPSIAVKIKVRLRTEWKICCYRDSREWTNTIWKQIETNVLSITLHQKQAFLLLRSTGKVHGINHNFFLVLGRQLY